jgi:hypothetical protein
MKTKNFFGLMAIASVACAIQGNAHNNIYGLYGTDPLLIIQFPPSIARMVKRRKTLSKMTAILIMKILASNSCC